MLQLVFDLNNGGHLAADLDQPQLRIGRAEDNDVIIDSPAVSARHAELRRQPDGRWLVQDLESAHGTRVNGESVALRLLQENDRLDFGGIEAVLRRAPPATAIPAQVDLAALAAAVRSVSRPRDASTAG